MAAVVVNIGDNYQQTISCMCDLNDKAMNTLASLSAGLQSWYRP